MFFIIIFMLPNLLAYLLYVRVCLLFSYSLSNTHGYNIYSCLLAVCVFVFYFLLMPVFVFVLQFILFTSLVIVFVTKIITTTINNIFFSSQQLAIFILAYSMRLISLPSCGCFGVLCMCLFKCPWLYASFIIVVTKIYYLYVCLFILCFLSFERAFLSLLKKTTENPIIVAAIYDVL